jgi:hypothetical protein
MDESNDVTNTTHLMIFILGSEGGFSVMKSLIVHVTWNVLQFAEVNFVLWNWDKTDKLRSVTCEMAHICSSSKMSHVRELQNPIIFDYIIQQHAMTNICAADEIICGHSDFRGDLYSTLYFRTLSLPTFSRSRVSIWRRCLSLAEVHIFIYLVKEIFREGKRKAVLRFTDDKWSRFWIYCGRNVFS